MRILDSAPLLPRRRSPTTAPNPCLPGLFRPAGLEESGGVTAESPVDLVSIGGPSDVFQRIGIPLDVAIPRPTSADPGSNIGAAESTFPRSSDDRGGGVRRRRYGLGL